LVIDHVKALFDDRGRQPLKSGAYGEFFTGDSNSSNQMQGSGAQPPAADKV